jgi:hypothetical protein
MSGLDQAPRQDPPPIYEEDMLHIEKGWNKTSQKV